MTTAAWTMLLVTWAVIFFFTGKFFWMVLTIPPRPPLAQDDDGALHRVGIHANAVGMTLAELQNIGREVGIPAESIAERDSVVVTDDVHAGSIGCFLVHCSLSTARVTN